MNRDRRPASHAGLVVDIRGSAGRAGGSPVPRALACVAALVALLALSGCTGFHYVVQAGVGQLAITMAAQSLDDVVGDPRTPLRTRALLRQVPSIKRFGERHGLKPTGNYVNYVDLGRPAAVWVVTAAAPLRFRAKTWSFPIIGTVPYLGWFHKEDANEFAAGLRRAGWDVDVRGAGAFSTLGWFTDPVLSTMIEDGDEALGELANVVLHESLHATLYLHGQTRLNESLATFVGDELAKVYLDELAGPRSVEKAAYLSGRERRAVRRSAMQEAYARLDSLYASSAPAAVKRAKKRAVLAELEASVGARRPINNATLAQFRFYNSGTDDLQALLDTCGGDWRRFIASLKQLERRRFNGPLAGVGEIVQPLIRAGCRPG